MKKCLILLLVLCLTLSVSAIPAVSDGSEDSDGFIILPHADDDGFIAIYQSKISLLGACNPDFPLYINSDEIPTTVNGYFAVYVELEVGDNPFVFENGDEVVELTVTRKVPEPGITESIEFYDEPIYGIARNESISRFYDGDDDNNPGTPLLKGTAFRIIAEYRDFYIIHDNSYVFKNSVDLFEEDEDIIISELPPLYSVDLQENWAEVSIYHFNKDIEMYTIPYEEDEAEQTIVGYYVEFTDGEITVHLNYAPVLLSQAVVLLDAGHGGKDPGALGPPGEYGLMEKDFNLYVAEKTRDYLENRGVSVIFLRDNDVHFPVVERLDAFADYENLSDLAISIHANSMSMHKDFTSDQGPLMFYSLEHSEQVANVILEQVTVRTGHELVPAHRIGFAMARYTAAPSMLFEMGYVCNPYEYEILLDTDYLDIIGESLGEGIVQYLLNTAYDDTTIIREEPAEAVYVGVLSETTDISEQSKSFRFTIGIFVFIGIVVCISLFRIYYEIKK